MIEIRPMSLEEFRKHELDFSTSNFLQSAEMFEVYQHKYSSENLLCLGFWKSGILLGQTLVLLRRYKRFFKEALVLHGPLCEKEVFVALAADLVLYLKHQGIARLSIHPLIVQERRDSELSILSHEEAGGLCQQLQELGFSQYLNPHQTLVVNQIFIKKLTAIQSQDDLLAGFSKMLKRNIKKTSQLPIVTREIRPSELAEFYHLLKINADKKQFYMPDLSYFQHFKEIFGNKAQFYGAFLNLSAYRSWLEQAVKDLMLQANEESQKQLTVCQTKLDLIDELMETAKEVLFSAHLYLRYGDELIYLYGASHEEFRYLSGPSLLHWQLLQTAVQEGIAQFNFYGTMEISDAHHHRGNFQFKKQFGGELQILVGGFSLTLHPILKLLEKLKSRS